MTVTFASADGGGGNASNSNTNDNGNNNNNHNNNNENTVLTALDSRRVLGAKMDSLSNVVNNVATSRYNRRAANGSRANKEAVMSVRRVLFGPPDHPAVTRAWLERQLYVVASKNSRSYNFDFANERPMLDRPNNRYAWERICKPVVVAPPPPPQIQVIEEPAAVATSTAADTISATEDATSAVEAATSVAAAATTVAAAAIPAAAAATPAAAAATPAAAAATPAAAAATPAANPAAAAATPAAVATTSAAVATTSAAVVVQEVQAPTECSRTTMYQSKLTDFMKAQKRSLSDKAAAAAEEELASSSQSAPKRTRLSVSSAV